MDEIILIPQCSMNDLSNDIIQSRIFLYLTPPKLLSISSVSKLFHHLVLTYNWKDDAIAKHPEIYYIIYNKTKTYLPLNCLITKAWIEYEKVKNNIKNPMKEIMKWPAVVNTNRLSRQSGILITGGAFQSEHTTETIFIPQVSSSSEAEEVIRLDDLPYSIGAMASALVDGRCLFLGGWDNDEESSINRIISFNLDDDTEQWAICDEILPANLCYGAACTDASGNLFFIGGSDNPYRGAEVSDRCFIRHNYIPYNFHKHPPQDWISEHVLEGIEDQKLLDQLYFEFNCENEDVIENNWTEIPSMIIPRCGHGSFRTMCDKIVSVGGYKGGDDGYLKSCEIFDFEKGWSLLPEMEFARSGPGAVIGPDNAIYCYGGSENGEMGLATFEMLDLRSKCWEKLPSSQLRGYTSASIASNSQIFLTGGITDRFSKNANSIDIYDIRGGKWFEKEKHIELLNRNSHNCIFVL